MTQEQIEVEVNLISARMEESQELLDSVQGLENQEMVDLRKTLEGELSEGWNRVKELKTQLRS